MTGERGKFERAELLTAGYRQWIRPCGEQWHLHKNTNTNVALNSQNRRTNKGHRWTSFEVQLTHCKTFLLSTVLQSNLTKCYSSLDPSRILILTYAQLIRSSTTKKKLSYNVPYYFPNPSTRSPGEGFQIHFVSSV